MCIRDSNCSDDRRERFWSRFGFARNGIDAQGEPLMLLPPEEDAPVTVGLANGIEEFWALELSFFDEMCIRDRGASAAAVEMGVDVDVMYSWQYGGTFSASPELQTMINGWYVNGTEVVLSLIHI